MGSDPLHTTTASTPPALDWCRSLAERAPVALRYMKQNLNRAITCDLETALDAEATAMVRTMTTVDHREAAAAFVEKRTPRLHRPLSGVTG